MNKAKDSKIVSRKWNIVNDNSRANYYLANEIIFNAKVLRSSFCDYNDAYILVIGHINIKRYQGTQKAFKNCAPITK